MTLKFIDSHCHLDRIDLSSFEGKISALIEKADEANVSHMLCVGIHPLAWQKMADLAEPYQNIFLSFGLHPGDLKGEDANLTVEDFSPYLNDQRVIAIGETGLDYHYGFETKALQQKLFALQIEAARYYQKPLIIHTREAKIDTISLMKAQGADQVGGVMHCFTEDWMMAKKALDLGFYISFSGIITFKNADALRSVAEKVPLDRLLIETDAPYLTPVPFRGKTNHPALVPYVAKALAEIKGVSLEAIAKATTHNFKTLFKVTL